MTDRERAKYATIQERATQAMIGKRFGRLVIMSYTRVGKSHHKYFLCRCDCGTTKEVSITHLRSGKIRSCGCLWQDQKTEYRKTHGGRRDALYAVWCGVKERCLNPNCQAYKNYGGRGITIADEWLDYAVFKQWATTHGYRKGLEINRIDNNAGYSQSNCNFVTAAENSRNKRTNVVLEHNGRVMILADWAQATGIRAATISARITRLGWDITKALTTPARIQHAV